MKWFLKQLFPLTYRSHYRESGKKVFCVWKMWLGRCYAIEKFFIL